MRRLLKVFTIALLVMFSSTMLLAQESPFVGSWKRDPAKSKLTGAPAPKSETRTVKAQRGASTVTFDRVDTDGSKFSFSYTTNLDGKASPITGSGVPGGADAYASKGVDANTYATTWLKGGKEIGMSRTVVSRDGKVTTTTFKGKDATGKPISAVTVYDKQ